MITKFHDYDVILRRLSEQRMGELEFVPNLNLTRVVAVTRNMTEVTRLRVPQTGADDLIADALSHEDIFMKVQNPVHRGRGFQEKPAAGHDTPTTRHRRTNRYGRSHSTARRASRPRSPLQSRSYEPESLKVGTKARPFRRPRLAKTTQNSASAMSF